jgi:hypothetical protein
MEHLRGDCAEFTVALKNEATHFNETDCLINWAIGEEFPVMYDKGGMKNSGGRNQWEHFC